MATGNRKILIITCVAVSWLLLFNMHLKRESVVWEDLFCHFQFSFAIMVPFVDFIFLIIAYVFLLPLDVNVTVSFSEKINFGHVGALLVLSVNACQSNPCSIIQHRKLHHDVLPVSVHFLFNHTPCTLSSCLYSSVFLLTLPVCLRLSAMIPVADRRSLARGWGKC